MTKIDLSLAEPKAMNDDPFPSFSVPKSLDRTVRRELERRGVDSMRDLLRSTRGTAPNEPVPLPPRDGGVQILRGHVEMWLREKDRASARWIKTGAIAAVVGAIVAIVAAALAFLAWAYPIKAISPQSTPPAAPQSATPNLLPGTRFQRR